MNNLPAIKTAMLTKVSVRKLPTFNPSNAQFSNLAQVASRISLPIIRAPKKICVTALLCSNFLLMETQKKKQLLPNYASICTLIICRLLPMLPVRLLSNKCTVTILSPFINRISMISKMNFNTLVRMNKSEKA